LSPGRDLRKGRVAKPRSHHRAARRYRGARRPQE